MLTRLNTKPKNVARGVVNNVFGARYLNPKKGSSSRNYLTSSSSSSSLMINNNLRLLQSIGRNSRSSASLFASGASNSSSNNTRAFSNIGSLLLKEYPEHIIFPLPALSPTMDVGTIAKWEKQEGDEFVAGDVLCTIDTDKASVDFDAQDDGILAKILKEGKNAEDLPVGTPICVVVENADDVAAFADFTADDVVSAGAGDAASASDAAAVETPPAAIASSDNAEVTVEKEFVLMPAARHLSESKGFDATGLPGTGKGGRVTKGDVLQAIADGVTMPALQRQQETAAAAPAKAVAAPPKQQSSSLPHVDIALPQIHSLGTHKDVKNNKMRKIIAGRLTQSKREVPHFYTAMEVELDEIMKLRKVLKKDHDIKVSVNDLVIRCCALSLRDVPEVNGTYDIKSDTVKLQETIDVSVAVATPTGLITPIIPMTDKLGLAGISSSIRDLATRARDGKLQPHEYQGGTFCVSNLGMFGIDEFSAVINPPQAAILAVGGGTKKVVSTPYVDGAEKQPKPSIKTIMTARLSADRRVVDEPTAALFMAAFRRYMNQPELMLL